MKILLIALAVVALVPLAIAIAGACMPRNHVASRAADYRRPVGELYAAVRDFARQAEWRSGLKRIEVLPVQDGKVRFREVTSHGAVPYLVLEDRPNERIVIEIADTTLPYGGTWTFEFQVAPAGETLRITERGFVSNVIFRFMARTVFSPTASMETYLRDLGSKFGESVVAHP